MISCACLWLLLSALLSLAAQAAENRPRVRFSNELHPLFHHERSHQPRMTGLPTVPGGHPAWRQAV